MNPKVVFIVIFVLFSSFIAICDKNEVHVDSSQEDFNQFFNKFKSDSVFRYSRIIFPLEGKNSDPDLLDENGEWTGGMQDSIYYWPEYLAKEHLKIEFELYDDMINTINRTQDTIIVRNALEGTGFYIERKFKAAQGKWYLWYFIWSNF